MSRVISLLILLILLFCGWRVFVYWEKVKKEERQRVVEVEKKPESLPGLPDRLRDSYAAARQNGPAVMRTWLKTYGHLIQDPRKAWIELDFCMSIARDDPAEARRIFAQVKGRTPESSPVWPRIKQMEGSFE
jgi:hypothetical protein